MRITRTDIMGMPIIVEVIDGSEADIEAVFNFFSEVDSRFSPYKLDSEVSQFNRGALVGMSSELTEIMALAEKTKLQSRGFFNCERPDGTIDPSGITKGWAIKEAARLLVARGVNNFYIDAGGDIQTKGTNAHGEEWRIGIRNPFNREEVVKVVTPHNSGIATSGSAVRGDHIYNPHMPHEPVRDIISITVVGPNVLEADRFATAAFAMGTSGISFIESLEGFEGYQVDHNGMATYTSGFDRYSA